MIRILIADDHPVVRAGLSSMLGMHSGLEVLASVASGEEALAAVNEKKPDILLLDLRMPGMGGLDVLRSLKGRADGTKVIVLTSYETDEDIYRAVEAGARGYLLKNTSETEMLAAIETVQQGQCFFPPSVAARLAERLARASLTARETGILELLAKGLTNRQIGSALQISEHTARNHVNSIIEKLGVSDRTEAVITALQQGLVTLP